MHHHHNHHQKRTVRIRTGLVCLFHFYDIRQLTLAGRCHGIKPSWARSPRCSWGLSSHTRWFTGRGWSWRQMRSRLRRTVCSLSMLLVLEAANGQQKRLQLWRRRLEKWRARRNDCIASCSLLVILYLNSSWRIVNRGVHNWFTLYNVGKTIYRADESWKNSARNFKAIQLNNSGTGPK